MRSLAMGRAVSGRAVKLEMQVQLRANPGGVYDG
jgi:hypothetical protein